MIDHEIKKGTFDTNSFIFVTSRSQSVACCWVQKDYTAARPEFNMLYTAVVPGCDPGVVIALIWLAIKYVTIELPRLLRMSPDQQQSYRPILKLELSESKQTYNLTHLLTTFKPLLMSQYNFR